MRKAKVKDTDCIINVMPKDTGGYIGSDGVTYKESQLDFLSEESPESATETWWLARDYDGKLYMSNREPELVSDVGIFVAGECYSVQLPEESFPSIAPKKCYKATITITQIEDE